MNQQGLKIPVKLHQALTVMSFRMRACMENEPPYYHETESPKNSKRIMDAYGPASAMTEEALLRELATWLQDMGDSVLATDLFEFLDGPVVDKSKCKENYEKLSGLSAQKN